MSVRGAALCLALFTLTIHSHAFVEEAVEVLKVGKEIGEEILNYWDVLSKTENGTINGGGVELPFIKRREREILARLSQVTKTIERLQMDIERTSSITKLLIKTVGGGPRLEIRLHEIADLLSRIGGADRQLREYLNIQEELEKMTLEDFAVWCVSHDPGALPGLLERVHSLIVPSGNHLLGRGLLQMIADSLEENHPDLCSLQISPHQLIYDMYNTISLTEIKGYAMMQFSWMLLRIYGKGNFVKEASLTRERYGERTSKTAAAARAALAMASRDIYTCDPHEHIEGVTYAQVTRLLQGFVVNEVDLNPDSTCRDNCAAYTLTKTYGCFKDQYCIRQPKCSGRIIDCQYVDSDMWICPASNSHRRYEWIEYENGMTLGRTGRCTRGTTKVDSWWRWLFWHCSYCMCLCDETSQKSDRYFSLREATSDIANNKVVTGIRFVKIGRVFHLQINEGTLSERGNVLPGDWVAVQPFDPLDIEVTENVDYHTLTYEQRGLDLDELHSPSGHILTGVRFHMLGSHLHFEIRSTPFNYTTGRLVPEKSEWISNDNTEGSETPRAKLELFRPDIPTRGLTPLPLDSRHDQYIEFTNSDLEADAAQSTVPFIDIQPLLPLKGASLNSGAGVVHRGARGSGGFVALKLVAYELSRHVRAEPPHSQFDRDLDATELPSIVN